MSSIYIKDGETAVIVLEIDGDRAYIASTKVKGVSKKSVGRFDEELELTRAGLGLYRTNPGDFESNYVYYGEGVSLKDEIDFVKKYNLKSNKENMKKDVFNEFAINEFFTKETIASSVAKVSDIENKVKSLENVADYASTISYRLRSLNEALRESVNASDVKNTKDLLGKIDAVVESISKNETLKGLVELGVNRDSNKESDFSADEFLSV